MQARFVPQLGGDADVAFEVLEDLGEVSVTVDERGRLAQGDSRARQAERDREKCC